MSEREAIVAEIQRLHSEFGASPGIAKFTSETGISQARIIGIYWARWSDALAEAGVPETEWQQKYDSDDLLTGLALFARQIGRFPTSRDLRLGKRQGADLASDKVYSAHFSNAEGIRQALAGFCENRPEFADILPLIPDAKTVAEARSGHTLGYVYLMRSGANYKIGRTDNIERRFREITIALPDATEIVHTISTDDPVGIEGYWHKRFADRHVRGEWFKLNRDDVRAFRKRKFQ